MSSAELTVWRNNKVHKPLMVVTVLEWLEWQHTSEFPAPLAEVPALIAEARAARQDGNKAHYTKIKNTLPAVSASGVWASRKRGAAKLQQPSGYHVLDYDSHQVDGVSAAVDVRDNALHLPYTRAAWLSPSGMGCKILVAVKPTTDPDEHKALVQAIRQHYDKRLGITLDDKTDDIGHLCYVSTDDDLRERSDPERWTVPALPNKLRHLADRISKAPEGDRHATRRDMGRTAGGLVAAGTLPEALTVSTLVTAALSNTATPEVARAEILEAIEYGKREPLVDEPPGDYTLTENGLARQLADKHRDELIWQAGGNGGYWWRWNGKYWQPLQTALELLPLVQEIADNLMLSTDAAAVKWGRRASGTTVQRNALTQAAPLHSRPEVVWDDKPMLLNVANGTLNLASGKLQAPLASDYLTVQAPTPYDTNAKAPRWERFLLEVFGGEREIINYVQRMLGYCITGDTSEQLFFLLHGTGANGKSTLLTTVKNALGGEYARHISTQALTPQQTSATPELARLQRARLVTAQETDMGQKLAEGIIKTVSGDEIIQARALYQAPVEFFPEFKLLLATNQKPRLHGGDYALFRRIHLIPFEQRFEPGKQDITLQRALNQELPGVLNWLVDGAVMWQERRLKDDPPEVMLEALAEYKKDMDPIGRFLEEVCMLGPEYDQSVNLIWAGYQYWADTLGNQPHRYGKQRFVAEMEQHGLRRIRTNKQRFWAGAHLNDTVTAIVTRQGQRTNESKIVRWQE